MIHLQGALKEPIQAPKTPAKQRNNSKRDGLEDADSQGDGSSQPDTISIASRTSQNTVDSDKLSGGCELTVVLQDFIAIHSSELSIQVGQTVELLERPSDRPGWCLVRTTERSPPQEGLVPSSALCISHSRSSVEMECFFPSGKDAFSVSAGENGGKSESVANLQAQPSLNSIQSSPGPKRSTNTLKKWLTSPVRRLNSGKTDSNIKKQKKRDGRNLGSPRTGDETTPQGDSADEKGKKGWDEEQDDESHTPLPPPMKIFDNDPTQDDKTLDGGSYRGSQKNSVTDGYLNEGLTPSPAPRNHEEEQRAKALRGRMFVLNELVQTEKDYVKDLGVVVESFIPRMEEKGAPEDMKGKDKIVFGNIHQIYDWHKDFFMAELQKCPQEPERLAQLFIKHERRLHMYVIYCQNKPRSEHVVAEYDSFFEEVKQEINQRFTISDFLIKPIQRITKYQLLLKDFLKFSEKAGLDCSDIQKSVALMCLVPKRCNDMMNLGRLQGFEGKLTAQGKLLQQDTFYVIEQETRTKERRVFLFEQIVIFSELLRKGSATPGYMFKRSIKPLCLTLLAVLLVLASLMLPKKDANSSEESECDDFDPSSSMEIMNPNFIQEVAPEVLVPLVDVTCVLGDTVTLHCRVCGRPKPSITWKGPDQNVLDSDSNTYTVSASDSGDITLRICNLMPQDSGIYTCVAGNELGVATTSATIKVQGVPSAPGRPLAQERSSYSVILRWLPPSSTGNCTISSYTMEYREEGSPVWQQSVASTLDTYLVLEDLCPGSQYQFRVSASNPWGISLPSDPSEPVRLPENDTNTNSAIISWKENFDQVYVELQEIGRGRFSIVKKCVQKTSKKDVAVKFISKKLRKREQVAHEAALSQHLQHPQYITIHDTYESAGSYILIMDLMDDGRLFDYLMNHDELMEEKIVFYVRDIMEALQYLHNCRVAHLDMKPENLLIDLRISVPRVKIIDLEDAVQITGHYYVHKLLGNPEFAAPEVIHGTPVSLGTDIWSLGVLTYVMLSGVSPFLDESSEETCVNICRVDFSFPRDYFSSVSHAAQDFIRAILQGDARWRPTVGTCLQHPWLQSHNGGYSKMPLETSRLASFIERRRHQNDARPLPCVKNFIVSRNTAGT
ncbi:kalirin-like [Ascaphus truei]|uniref:kalirin-like n=1 Tax=Ascaphus truei TaxID=8439 RepID=UPI003F599406